MAAWHLEPPGRCISRYLGKLTNMRGVGPLYSFLNGIMHSSKTQVNTKSSKLSSYIIGLFAYSHAGASQHERSVGSDTRTMKGQETL